MEGEVQAANAAGLVRFFDDMVRLWQVGTGKSTK